MNAALPDDFLWICTTPVGRGQSQWQVHAFPAPAMVAIVCGAEAGAPGDHVGVRAMCGEWFAVCEFNPHGGNAPCEKCLLATPLDAKTTPNDAHSALPPGQS